MNSVYQQKYVMIEKSRAYLLHRVLERKAEDVEVIGTYCPPHHPYKRPKLYFWGKFNQSIPIFWNTGYSRGWDELQDWKVGWQKHLLPAIKAYIRARKLEVCFLQKLSVPQKGPWHTSIWGSSKEKAIFLFLCQCSHLLIIPTHVPRASDNLFQCFTLNYSCEAKIAWHWRNLKGNRTPKQTGKIITELNSDTRYKRLQCLQYYEKKKVFFRGIPWWSKG